jgi:hypothetical protein
VSVETTATKCVELCKQGTNFDVMRTRYAPDLVPVGGDGRETKGRQPVIRNSEVYGGNNAIHGRPPRGPFFCGGHEANVGQFAVFHTPDVTRKAGGERATIDEVAPYTVENDKITREEFFYDGIFQQVKPPAHG